MFLFLEQPFQQPPRKQDVKLSFRSVRFLSSEGVCVRHFVSGRFVEFLVFSNFTNSCLLSGSNIVIKL